MHFLFCNQIAFFLEGGKSGGGYRDRADERRKQKEAFYAHVAEELAEIKERSVEESKFLVRFTYSRI